jgi:hypothetical protein
MLADAPLLVNEPFPLWMPPIFDRSPRAALTRYPMDYCCGGIFTVFLTEDM